MHPTKLALVLMGIFIISGCGLESDNYQKMTEDEAMRLMIEGGFQEEFGIGMSTFSELKEEHQKLKVIIEKLKITLEAKLK